MKKLLLFTVLILIIVTSTMAQSTQSFVVLQYNQKKPKTPLAGVEVMAKGASTAISQIDGKLTLSFHTLKPGDKIKDVLTTKSGYEIFNTDVVNNWIISRNNSPFELIMVRSDYFAQYKSNLTQISQDSYKRKLAQKEKELEKLKEEGKLKEEEFHKKIDELHDSYFEQLKNLNKYIDQFARIDMSEVSSVEQRILEMVEEGKIEEAILVFDSLDLTKKIETEAEDILELTKSIKSAEDLRTEKKENLDALYKTIKRKVSLQLMAHKINEAQKDLSSVLDVFSKLFKEDANTYRSQVADLQLQLGLLLSSYKETYYKAGSYIDSALSNYFILYKAEPERYHTIIIKAEIELAKHKEYTIDYSSSEQLLNDALYILEQHAALDNLQYNDLYATVHQQLCRLYFRWNAKQKQAEINFLMALEEYTLLTQQDTSNYHPKLASLKTDIAYYYDKTMRLEKAEKFLSYAIDDYQILAKKIMNTLKH